MNPNPLISRCFSLTLTLILLIAAFAHFKVQRERHFMSPNPLISRCFSLTLNLILLIAAFAATSTVLIVAYAVSTCDRRIFPFQKSFAMTSFSLTIFSHFYFRKLFPLVRDQFRYTTHAQTLCKWAGACRNWPRTPESQHAWYVGPTLAKVTGKWEYNQYRHDRRVCVDEGLDGSALFLSAIIILINFLLLSGIDKMLIYAVII